MQSWRILRAALACAALLVEAVPAAHGQQSPAEFIPPKLHDIGASPYTSRQIIELAANTLMIIGKPNDLRANDPDVGNIVLHRAGETLYVVDSGALESYRPVILEAVRRLGPVKTAYLFNTHNHTDHIANNDLLWEISAERHYLLMPRLTMDIVKSPLSHAEYYAKGTGRIQQFAPVVPDLVKSKDSTTEYWLDALAPFKPMRPMVEKAIPFEHFPLQRLDLGTVRQTGWKITEDVYVLPTRGHTMDSVVVFFPKLKLICLGDETNRLYHIFQDGDGINSFQFFQRLLEMLDSGAIQTMVDSHHFHVFNAGQSRQWLTRMLEAEEYEQDLIARTLRNARPRGLRLDEMIAALSADPQWSASYLLSKATFPIVIPMVLLKRMRDMGVEELGSPPNTRFLVGTAASSLPEQKAYGIPGTSGTDGTAAATRTYIIRNVRLFDGERVVRNATVVVRGETIAQVLGADEPEPAVGDPFSIVDGTGQTLLPGFLDAHAHVAGKLSSLQDSLRFGVTTVFDLYMAEKKLVALREAVRYEPVGTFADYFTAGQCANVPGGHGTRDPAVDTISKPEEADAWVRRRLAAGVDYIKIVIEPGFFRGHDIATLDGPTVRALIDAAHRHGILAIVHVSRTAAAEQAIGAGADILAHSWAGGITVDMTRDLVRKDIAVIPTIGAYDGLYDNKGPVALVQDVRIRTYLPDEAIPTLTNFVELPPHERSSRELQVLTGHLYRHGVRLLAGTDAQNVNTWAGASLHREMELLVQSGLKPIDALRAATSAVADAFRKGDRGRIAAGKLADLVLVSGDPLVNIRDTRNITAIWKRGHLVERTVRD